MLSSLLIGDHSTGIIIIVYGTSGLEMWGATVQWEEMYNDDIPLCIYACHHNIFIYKGSNVQEIDTPMALVHYLYLIS